MIGRKSTLGRAAYPRRVAGGAQGSPREDSYGYEKGRRSKPNQSKNNLNMGQSDNRLRSEPGLEVANPLVPYQFGE
jgi:hypothetical protein